MLNRERKRSGSAFSFIIQRSSFSVIPMLVPFVPQYRGPRRRSKSRVAQAPSPPPPPPPPTGATIINMWLEDALTLNVQFDRPVEVVEGHNVGAWMVHDDVNGDIVPTEMTQVDVDTI